jgi:hypothetical protein
MVSGFTQVGIISVIHPTHLAQSGNESIALTLDVEGSLFYVLLTGKLLTLVQNEQIRIGDKVYVQGKLIKDRAISVECPKNVCVLFVSFLSVI